MRRYESPEDRRNQNDDIELYGYLQGASQMLSFPDYSRGDAFLQFEDGKSPILIEYKFRNNESGQYGTYMIDADKVEILAWIAAELKCRFHLLVRFTDDLGVISLDAEKVAGYQRKWGGNAQRAPREVVLIPIEEFTFLDVGPHTEFGMAA